MTKEALKEILDKHLLWIEGEEDGVRADLSGADLSGGDLHGANLSEADLSGADLSGGDLSGADLSRANLSRANLSDADLWRANLSGADLSRANLSGADLSRANLSRADLSGANLSGANLWRAEKIMAFGPMPTSGRIIYAVRHDSGWMVQAGCFWGDLDTIESKVKESHNCPVYIAIINLLRSIK